MDADGDADGRAGADLARLVRARVEGDWAAVRALTGPGYAYCEAGTGRRIDDVDDVLAALERLHEAAPDAHVAIGPVHAAGDVTVADLVWSATLAQRRLRADDRVWTRWADGKLIAEWHEVGILTMVAPLVDAELAARRVATAAPGRG
jgi:hypothetical protein